MGDDQYGPARDQGRYRVLDLGLRPGVGEGGGLVEDEYGGVREERAGDGDPLCLAAGEGEPLADHRVVAVRQRQYPLMDPGRLGRRPDLVVTGLRPAEPDVVAERAADQLDVLEHEADIAVELGGAQLVDVHPAHGDPVEPSRRGSG